MLNHKSVMCRRYAPAVQTKLKIGQPGDKYEQEADVVADRVLKMSEPDTMQMQPIEEEEELLQPKLRMQPLEEEEEMLQPKIQMQPLEEEEEVLQTKIQMQPEEEEEEELMMKQISDHSPKSENRRAETSTGVSNAINTTRGNGQTLNLGTESEMGSKINADFTNVKIHTDSHAHKMSHRLGAQAFTVGNDIYFNEGKYNPTSKEGKQLLAHELTHTIQQGAVKKIQHKSDPARKTISTNARTGIQRLIQSNHPWTGVVVNTPLLALRDGPNGTTLADLPDDTLVNVQGVSSGWLDLEVDTTQSGVILNRRGRSARSGDILDGYSYHSYIDDAAAAEMTEMIGEEATWVPSGPSSGNSFQTWASAATESAAPPVTSVTTINCWEMVLMAAYRIGAIDWQWIHDLYTNTTGNWYDELPNRMTSGSTTAHDLSAHTPLPARGDIVFFDGASHVALATGNGEEIITFWPPPNTAFTSGGTVDDVKLSTIVELSDWMTANLSTPVVTFGSPAW